MPNTLKIKRGLAASIPQGQLAEPLFTTDTYDLYIGKGSGGNQRIQNYIASGTTNDILRGDGSVYTFPLGISSPSAGQVLKYNGTSWVNDSDAGITGTGTTNTLPKFTGATTLGNSNVTDSGTLITLGSNSYVNGALGIGTTSLTGYNLRVTKNITGATTSIGIHSDGTIQSDVTGAAYLMSTNAATVAASFTLNSLSHYRAFQTAFGAGSAVTNQYGFLIDASLTGATNNYGFYGNIASGTNRWNLYMNGTANNYMAGALGIGITSIGTNSLQINRSTTGAATANTLTIITSAASDVTNRLSVVTTNIGTDAASFTLGTLEHYRAQQGTFGVGSTVTTQVGFRANSNLTGATNNYGFQGSIPAQANAWNLYMDGTANNYMAGSLGIGTTSLTGYNLRVSKNLTGSTSTTGIQSAGAIQSDVTSDAQYFSSGASTAAAAFTVTDLAHFIANQGTFGAGSTVTKQYGFRVAASLTGATNNYAFFSDIASGTNRWNLYMNGTANNYLAGSLGIGSTSLTAYNLRLQKNITGAVTSYAISSEGEIQSDVTTGAAYFSSLGQTAAASFTLSNLYHFVANQTTLGAGSTVTNQYGFFVNSNLTGATNNYGFYGNIASGANRWNLYMNGTADNHLGGKLTIGSTTTSSNSIIYISRPITGSASSNGIIQELNVSSDVTTQAFANRTILGTAAASFTLPILSHYIAGQGTIGAGSTVTTQIGYWAQSNMIGATTNVGFYGDIASGANRWNLYMNGTANNYLAGSLGIGNTSLTGINLRVQKDITGGTAAYGVIQGGTVLSDVTSQAWGFNNSLSTQASAFTLTHYYHYASSQSTIGATSAVTNQYGFYVFNSLTGATNNYGFYGNIASGANRWNLYMNGTAANYLAGVTSIGTTTTATNIALLVGGADTQGIRIASATAPASYYTDFINYYNATKSFEIISGGTSIFRTSQNGTLSIAIGSASGINYEQSGTNGWFRWYSVSTTRMELTSLGTLNIYGVITPTTALARGIYNNPTLQATANNDTLVSLDINPNFTNGAFTGVNNYALRLNTAAATNAWNIYASGTAANYLAGNLSIGTTSSNGRLTIQPANDTVGISVSGSSLTGTNAQSLLDLSQTWNTTGNPTAFKLNITNTASGAAADLMELQVGGVNQFVVDKAGVGYFNGTSLYNNAKKKKSIYGNATIAAGGSVTINVTFNAACYVSALGRLGGDGFGGRLNGVSVFGIDTSNATAQQNDLASNIYVTWSATRVSSTSWDFKITNNSGTTASNIAYELEVNASDTITN